jgi:hypothetical protein
MSTSSVPKDHDLAYDSLGDPFLLKAQPPEPTPPRPAPPLIDLHSGSHAAIRG